MVPAGALLLALLLLAPQDDLTEARKAVAAAPDDFTAHFNLAFALTQQHKDDEAIAEYRRTLELKPTLYEADLNLGILLLRNKRPAEALDVLKEAAGTKPNEARPNLYYAQALLDTGDAAAAEQRYNAAATADPKSLPAKQGLARALLAEQKLPEAVDQFRALNDRNGLLEIAALYEKSGRTADAIAIYKEFPDDPALRQRIGQLEIDNKDAKGAIANLEEAVRKAPNTANRLALADAYRLNKQSDKVIEQLQLAAVADPNSFDVHMDLGRALRDQRKLVPAANQFFAATKLRPDSVPAWNELATALMVSENFPEALAALDHIRALGKEVPGNYFFRAIACDKLHLLPQALTAYRQFLATDNGANPNQEFQSRQRASIIEREMKK